MGKSSLGGMGRNSSLSALSEILAPLVIRCSIAKEYNVYISCLRDYSSRSRMCHLIQLHKYCRKDVINDILYTLDE